MKARVLLVLFAVSMAWNCASIGVSFDWTLVLAAFVAWYLADLASGLTHMYMDYRPCRPGVGLAELYFYGGDRESEAFLGLQGQVYGRITFFERLVYDFKKHHPMPDLLGRHGLIHLIKAPVMFVTLPLSLALNACTLVWKAPPWLMLGAVVFVFGVSLSQYFHGTLHRENNRRVIIALRAVGLLMSRKAHSFHHDTLTRDFSVINGWSNPLLNVVVGALLRGGLLDPAGLEPT